MWFLNWIFDLFTLPSDNGTSPRREQEADDEADDEDEDDEDEEAP
jgi:hypothetical protein